MIYTSASQAAATKCWPSHPIMPFPFLFTSWSGFTFHLGKLPRPGLLCAVAHTGVGLCKNSKLDWV